MSSPSASQLTPQEKAAMVKAVTQAIGYTENGGKPDLNALQAGKSGELKSIFQFTPDTWKAEAQKYLGNANEPLTPDAETTVVSKQVSDWIDEGKTISQMASIWNAGQGEPDAYTGKFSNGEPSVGVNKEGVKFNVPAYAKTVNSYAKQFYTQALAASGNAQTATNQPVSTNQPAPQVASNSPQATGLMQQAAYHVPWASSGNSGNLSPIAANNTSG